MRVTLATICLLILATATFAQSDRGTITGAVKDPAGAVVARADVIVRNIASGTEYKTVTTETGNYTVSSLPAGSYELRVEAPGFKKFLSQGILVQVAQTARINVALEIGASSETVSVTDQTPLPRTENAEQSANISGELFNSLPWLYDGRNKTFFFFNLEKYRHRQRRSKHRPRPLPEQCDPNRAARPGGVEDSIADSQSG